MILPYDTSMSYWMMAVPRFEWQPEPAPSSTDSCMPAEASGGAAPPGWGSDEPTLPRLRLVMTGMSWVAVPYWSPRENASWNAISEAARDDARQRTEAKDGETRRPRGDGRPSAAAGKESA